LCVQSLPRRGWRQSPTQAASASSVPSRTARTPGKRTDLDRAADRRQALRRGPALAAQVCRCRAGAESTRRRVGELLPEEHRAFVDDLLVRYGISAPTDGERLPPGDLNISPKGYQPLLDVAFAHRIRLIASALGSPPAETNGHPCPRQRRVGGCPGRDDRARAAARRGRRRPDRGPGNRSGWAHWRSFDDGAGSRGR